VLPSDRGMAGESFHLCAIIAPGSVEAEIGRVQAALFADCGLASAQAVPPLVPVAFLEPGRIRDGLLSRLDQRVPAGWSASLAEAGWVEGHLYARVESGGAWSALRDGAVEECGLSGSGLFPTAEGFYLGCADAPADSRNSIRPRVEPRRFRTAQLALVVFRTMTPGPGWWNELHWEITEERPLRGRRKP